MRIKDFINKCKSNDVLIFVLILVAVFVFSFLFFTPHYGIDSFATQNAILTSAKQVFSLGRVLASLFFYLFSITGINIIREQITFTGLSVLVFSVSIFLLQRLLLQMIKKNEYRENLIIRGTVISACFLMILNPFTAEHFAFPELTLFSSLSLLSVVISLQLLYEAKEFRHYLYVFVFLLASLSFYQAWIPFFPSIGIFILIFRDDNNSASEITRKCGKLFGLYMSAAMTNLLFIKCIAPIFVIPTKRFNNLNIVDNFQAILKLQVKIWANGLEVSPFGLLVWGTILGTILFMFSIRLSGEKKKIATAFFLSIIFLFIFSFGPVSLTSPIWLVPRIIVALGGMVGLVLFGQLLFINCLKESVGLRFVNIYLVSLMTAGLIIGSIYCFQFNHIAKNQIYSNSMDRQEILGYDGAVNNYEMQTGLKVKNISFRNDKSPFPCYLYTICSGDLNVRILLVPWGRTNAYNYYTGKNLKETNMDEGVYRDYFHGKNYGEFSLEQIVIIGDTANILVY